MFIVSYFPLAQLQVSSLPPEDEEASQLTVDLCPTELGWEYKHLPSWAGSRPTSCPVGSYLLFMLLVLVVPGGTGREERGRSSRSTLGLLFLQLVQLGQVGIFTVQQSSRIDTFLLDDT